MIYGQEKEVWLEKKRCTLLYQENILEEGYSSTPIKQIRKRNQASHCHKIDIIGLNH